MAPKSHPLTANITYRSLWESLRTQKRDFGRANLYGAAAALLFLPIPVLIPLLIDEILLGHPGNLTRIFALSGIDEAWGIIAGTLIMVLLLRGAVFGLNNAKSFYSMRIVQKSAYTLRHSLLHHLERMAFSEYETLKSGAVASKTIRDVENISAFLGQAATTALTSGLTLAGIMGVMFYISWPLAVMVMVLNPLFLGFSRIAGRKAGELLRRQNEAYDVYQSLLGEVLELFAQVRASNQERMFFGLLQSKAAGIRDAAQEYGYRSSVAFAASTQMTNAAVDVFRALGIAAVAYTDLSIGMMLAFLFYLSTAVAPVQQLLGLAITFQSTRPALERLNQLLEMRHEPHFAHEADPFDGVDTTSVELSDVSFAFDGAKPVLKGISIKADAGRKIALVGPSGSGKTTIARLLVGFYRPQSGTIAYGGVPIEKIGLPVVRENVALMLQESLFFNDTLCMNLTLGRAVEESAIFGALHAAQLDGFVKGLRDGLETRIGKNGIRLSGGERQRLAVARLILSDPKIVIFDEATSALDNETEVHLYETLAPFLERRTAIIIAHRTTTIRQADYIYVLTDHGIVSEGTFEQLNGLGLIGEGDDV